MRGNVGRRIITRYSVLSVRSGWLETCLEQVLAETMEMSNEGSNAVSKLTSIICKTPTLPRCRIIGDIFCKHSTRTYYTALRLSPTHSIISSGFSTTFLNSLIHSPPTAPSTTLWSKLPVTTI